MCSSQDSQPSAAQSQTAASESGADPGARGYAVQGMTCNHCAASVTEEVEQVSGVTGVAVDLDSGRLSVLGDGFSDESIRAAVDEAGYRVVSA